MSEWEEVTFEVMDSTVTLVSSHTVHKYRNVTVSHKHVQLLCIN